MESLQVSLTLAGAVDKPPLGSPLRGGEGDFARGQASVVVHKLREPGRCGGQNSGGVLERIC
eukprot:7460414-Pyramimonas_sp.AAC.1